MRLPATLLLLAALAVPASAKIVTQPVAYEHAGMKFESYLAYDDQKASSRKLPGVLIVPEWWGINDYTKGRAEKIAGLGYVALVADVFGNGFNTTDPRKAGEIAGPLYGSPLLTERCRAALDQLLKQSVVDPARVAATGYCFGGAAAQLLAYSGAPLVGMVSFHGGLMPASPEAAGKNKAKFLICHGAIDPTIDAAAFAAFTKSMNDGKFDYQLVTYAGAKHAFTNPNADKYAAAGLTVVAYNAAADRRSWEHLKVFFHEIFAAKE